VFIEPPLPYDVESRSYLATFLSRLLCRMRPPPGTYRGGGEQKERRREGKGRKAKERQQVMRGGRVCGCCSADSE